MADRDYFLAELLRRADLPKNVISDLCARMRAAPRKYHDLGHIALLWERHVSIEMEDGFKGDHAMRLAACAIAFHDAIIEPGRSDNEDRSAQLFRGGAADCMAADDVTWVVDTIRATQDHLKLVIDAGSWRGRLRQRIVDLDLTPLGETPKVFADNTQMLRLEQSNLDYHTWNKRRLSFLAKINGAPIIFRCGDISGRFERSARLNIERELAAVQADRGED